jgi:hypothetical protein
MVSLSMLGGMPYQTLLAPGRPPGFLDPVMTIPPQIPSEFFHRKVWSDDLIQHVGWWV